MSLSPVTSAAVVTRSSVLALCIELVLWRGCVVWWRQAGRQSRWEGSVRSVWVAACVAFDTPSMWAHTTKHCEDAYAACYRQAYSPTLSQLETSDSDFD